MKFTVVVVALLTGSAHSQTGRWRKVGQSVSGVIGAISGPDPTSGAGTGQFVVTGNSFADESAGVVNVYRAGGSAEAEATFNGEAGGDQFGAAIGTDFFTEAFVVGAPGADAGKGAIYVLDYSEFLEGWRIAAPNKIPLPDSNGVSDANFGAAVAMMDQDHLIACADGAARCYPFRNVENNAQAFEWQLSQTSTNGLTGEAGSGFGNAVDAIADRALIGASLGSYVQFIEKNDETGVWEFSWDTRLSTSNDLSLECGASVSLDKSNWAAFGCPGFGDNGEGQIQVVNVVSRLQLATIDGDSSIGNGLGGSVGIQGDCSSLDGCVVTTVGNGLDIQKYRWRPVTSNTLETEGEWEKVTEDLITAAGAKVATAKGDTQYFRTAVASGGNVDIYEVVFPSPAPTPTPLRPRDPTLPDSQGGNSSARSVAAALSVAISLVLAATISL